MRDRMLRGVEIFANAYASRSPQGRNVVLDKSFGAPRITKDGVNVARRSSSRTSSRHGRQMGARRQKTNDMSGDGTHVDVLAHAIVREAQSRLPPA